MKKIIHITSSTNGENSFSTRLGKAIIEKIQAQHPNSIVTKRDLIADPAPYVSSEHVAAFFTPEDLNFGGFWLSNTASKTGIVSYP